MEWMRKALAAGAICLALGSQAATAQTTPASAPAAPSPLRCPLEAPYDPDNPFARIIRGESPRSLIAENTLVLAFVPLDWRHRGHALVVPRRAVRNLNDMTNAEIIAVTDMVKRVALAQQRAFGGTGYSVQQNNGRSQDVCHAHFHVIPNTPAEDITAPRSRAEMDEVSAALKKALPAE